MRRLILVVVLGSILATNQSAMGFDGSRKGFLLELGAGLGGVHNELAVGTESKFALKTAFRIGIGISNQFAIHFGGWGLTYDGGEKYLESSVAGLGVTYFIAERAPSTFVTGVIGSLLINEGWAWDPQDQATGFALGIGAGREISKNWVVELDVSWGKPGSDSSIYGSNIYGIGVHLSHIFY